MDYILIFFLFFLSKNIVSPCDTSSGYFLNPSSSKCEYCSINCAECSTSSLSCSSCADGLTLTSSNECSSSESFELVAEDFLDTFNLNNNWQYSSLTVKTFCDPFTFIGGPNVFKSDSWIKKTINNLPKHYKMRLRVQFFIIGEWNSVDSGLVFVDGSQLLSIPKTEKLAEYGQNCAGSIIKSSTKVDLLFDHTADSIIIELKSSISSSTGFWAINRFQLLAYLCDEFCGNCEENPTKCTDCPSGTQLNSEKCDNICSIPQYYDVSTSTCSDTCPDNYYGDLYTATCVNKCRVGSYKFQSGSSKICFNKCPSKYYGDPFTGKCESTCSNGTYSNKTLQLCLFCNPLCNVCSAYTNCSECWMPGTVSNNSNLSKCALNSCKFIDLFF